MSDSLTIHGPSFGTLGEINRNKHGLAPHTEAFEKFLDDQEKFAADPKRPMIGCAVNRWKLYPDFDDE